MTIKIYVDDDLQNRPTPKGFIRFTDSKSFLDYMLVNTNKKIDTISFDNDLGLDSLEGYQLVNKVVERSWKVSNINLHSANVVAVNSTYKMLQRCQDLGIIKLDTLTKIDAVSYVNMFK